MRLLRVVLWLVGLAAAVLALVFVWLAIGVHLTGLGQRAAQGAVILALALVIWGIWRRRLTVPFAVTAGAAAVMTVWFSYLPASNDRIWAPEYLRTLTASIDGDLVTLEMSATFAGKPLKRQKKLGKRGLSMPRP
jgi:hypothetical protein